MPLRRSIRDILILSFFLFSTAVAASDFKCKEVSVEGASPKAKETSTLCFLRDNTYFLSEKCASLQCPFIERLKSNTTESNETERPGATICRAIGGLVEEVSVSGEKTKTKRCLFEKEKASASLNLLESWNGKHFTGPSKPLGM